MIRAYIRVSSKSQSSDGFGEAAQESAIRKFCAAEYPNEVIKTYIESGVSGTIPLEERDQSLLMLLDMQEGDTVIAFSVSRFSRMVWISAKFLHDMKLLGVNVVCLDAKDASTSASGAFMFHILAAVSQQDRENILKITEAGREEKRKIGGDLGGGVKPWQIRVGKKKDAILIDDQEKIDLIIRVRDLLADGIKYTGIRDLTGVSPGTITNWKKQLSDPNSEMSKKVAE